MSTEEIYQNVWHEKYLDSNTAVMVHIRRLREKMNDSAKNQKLLRRYGVWDTKSIRKHKKLIRK